jgi:hypothetical protein
MEEENVEYVKINVDNKEDYYKLLDELAKFNKDCITVSGTSKNDFTLILESTEDPDENGSDSDSEDDKGDETNS